MKKVVLNNLEREQLEVLQNELQAYSIHLYYVDLKQNFYEAIISLDIINHLYFLLRSRLESEKSKFHLNLKPSEAAVILLCVLNYTKQDAYTVAFFEKIKELIDKQLKNRVV